MGVGILMVWVADKQKSISVQALGEGYASIEVYAPSSQKPGYAVSVYCDLTNTGPVPDTFIVQFRVNGAITNYDVNSKNPVDPGATAPRLQHTFTMPPNNVAVTVIGHHWENSATGVKKALGWISPLPPDWQIPSLPPVPKSLRDFATVLVIATPIIAVGGLIAYNQLKKK